MAYITSSPRRRVGAWPFLVFLGLTLAVLLLLFRRCLLPEVVLFSNDGPFGGMVTAFNRLPATLTGLWVDLNWAGYRSGSPPLTASTLLRLVTSPELFSSIYAPCSLFFLGACAWVFFRSLRFSPIACALGGLAAALNSDFFSTACWGVAAQCFTFGFSFLALAALTHATSQRVRRKWLLTILAGSAVGMAVMEGFDIGAIFSLFVAAFAIYQAWLTGDAPGGRRLVQGGLRTAVVAVVAGIVAFHAISMLVGTQIKGVAGMEQDARTKATRWNEATQWSLPKKETAGFAVPGLFGFRMDTPGGGNYWGQVGRTAGWEEHGQGLARFSGGGFYAGILVLVVAVWTIVQSMRKTGSPFSDVERRWIWFWSIVAFISLLLAFGRYAPFYQFFYALPYFSTIRNPAKFVHVVSWALVILFAYGINGLLATHVHNTRNQAVAAGGSWWKRLSTFDRKWVSGAIVVFAAACIAWLMYKSAQKDLEAFLVKEAIGPDLAPAVARFSIHQLGLYVVLFGLALGLVVMVIAGFFSGQRARYAGIALGAFLIADLAYANQPWIVFVNYKEKYATNPVIDFLRQKPYEQRVAGLPFPAPQGLGLLDNLYRYEWHQHHFLYFNIQSLDFVQMPRMPEDIKAFDENFLPKRSPEDFYLMLRRWELMNVRYLLGPAMFVDALNQQVDPEKKRFRVKLAFNVVGKPGIAQPTTTEDLTAVLSTNGPYAVIEFTGALPRAKLYSHWQVQTNDQATLATLADRAFDPASTVLVAEEIGVPPAQAVTNAGPGEVRIISYKPKQVVLEASANQRCVLLLNDKFDPGWKLTVDGERAEILRCNFIMRGALLEPGEHTLEFSFEPEVRGLYVTLTALVVSGVLLGVLLATGCRESTAAGAEPTLKPRQEPEPKRRGRGKKK